MLPPRPNSGNVSRYKLVITKFIPCFLRRHKMIVFAYETWAIPLDWACQMCPNHDMYVLCRHVCFFYVVCSWSANNIARNYTRHFNRRSAFCKTAKVLCVKLYATCIRYAHMQHNNKIMWILLLRLDFWSDASAFALMLPLTCSRRTFMC